jgi:hypothetical protein
MFHHQNAGQSHGIKIANRLFENVQIFVNNSNKGYLIHGGNYEEIEFW